MRILFHVVDGEIIPYIYFVTQADYTPVFLYLLSYPYTPCRLFAAKMDHVGSLLPLVLPLWLPWL